MKFKNYIVSVIVFIAILFVFYNYARPVSVKKYSFLTREGAIDPAGLALTVDDIYYNFQTKKFEKFDSVPTIDQIGEQNVVLYNSSTSLNGKLYTVLNGTTYYAILTKEDSAVEVASMTISGSFTYMPAGTILTYVSSTAPSGFLYCDGTSVSSITYPALFAVIRYSFGGSGDNFNLPDFRGRFLRGLDNGANRDPDKATRTAMNTGGNTGDNIGSVQVSTVGPHYHETGTTSSSADVGGNRATHGTSADTAWNAPSGNPVGGGAETRPINANVAYIIKY